jgi:hypothetical protein
MMPTSAVYRNTFSIITLAFFVACLGGCMKPQIISPVSSLFAPNEYLVIEQKTSSRIGQLYEARQERDAKGKPLPLRWAPQPIMIFPQGDGFNSIEETALEQTRNVVQEAASSASLTAAAFGAVDGENKSAFKYQSKASKFSQLKMPLIYNKAAKTYMQKLKEQDPNICFAYMSGLYEGTAFIEVLNKTSTSGSGSYAAFQMGATYYTANMSGIINTGPVIYQIEPIRVDQLLDRNERPVHKPNYMPMTEAQLGNALQKGGDELRPMILLR